MIRQVDHPAPFLVVYDGWTLDTPRLAGRDGLHGSPRGLPGAASQGWNVVMVLDGLNSNATTRKYTWGLDLSGTTHGAGGIGGLLACEEPQAVGDPKRYWFLYDANGNVGQLIRYVSSPSVTLTIEGHYEYDPYGDAILIDNAVRQIDGTEISWNGGYAETNPVRFSTKWLDKETDLYYYGYRYYSPELGRWISRDPIGEEGGANLYTFVQNLPTSRMDAVGLQALCGFFPCPPRPPSPPPAPPPAPPKADWYKVEETWKVTPIEVPEGVDGKYEYTFTQTIGASTAHSVGGSVTGGLEAEAGVWFASVKSSVQASVNYSFSWTHEKQLGFAESASIPLPGPLENGNNCLEKKCWCIYRKEVALSGSWKQKSFSEQFQTRIVKLRVIQHRIDVNKDCPDCPKKPDVPTSGPNPWP